MSLPSLCLRAFAVMPPVRPAAPAQPAKEEARDAR